jgi:hypothetical protein
MTKVQIDYWQMLEGRRHNMAYEEETRRHNMAMEEQAGRELVETARHNLATESLTGSDIAEKTRHNKATESVSKGQLKIDKSKLKIEQSKLGLTAASLQENIRHNKATESINSTMASASVIQAYAAKSNAGARLAEYSLGVDKWLFDKKLASQETNAEISKDYAQAEYYQEQSHRTGINSVTDIIGSGVDVFKALKGKK